MGAIVIDYIAIGKIIQAHGTKGYLKVIPYSEIPKRFIDLKTVYVKNGKEIQGFIIEDIRMQNQTSLLKFKGVCTREAAQILVKSDLLIPENQKIELAENVYFIHELIGLKVFEIDGQYLGVLEDIWMNSGNDVYVVRNKQQEILIPAVFEFIKDINPQEKKIIVSLVDGMLE